MPVLRIDSVTDSKNDLSIKFIEISRNRRSLLRMLWTRALCMRGNGRFNIHTAVIGDDKIRGGEGKIHTEPKMFQDCKQTKFPKAGIECRLELSYELPIPVNEISGPFV